MKSRIIVSDSRHSSMYIIFNSSDAGDWLFRFGGSILCLMMPWPLKSPEHQQPWYWLCRTDNMYCCSKVNFTYLGQAKSKILLKMWLYLLQSLKHFSMLRVKVRTTCSMDRLVTCCDQMKTQMNWKQPDAYKIFTLFQNFMDWSLKITYFSWLCEIVLPIEKKYPLFS